MGLTHSQAREALSTAFAELGRTPSPHSLQAVQAIASLESAYGSNGGKNWGNIQCRQKPPCGPGCFEQKDTHADGTTYRWCYRSFDTHEEAARALAGNLYGRGVGPALEGGSAKEIADAMKASGYFEAKADRYSFAIRSQGQAIAAALGEPYLLGADHGTWKPGKGGGTGGKKPPKPSTSNREIFGLVGVTAGLVLITLYATKGART